MIIKEWSDIAEFLRGFTPDHRGRHFGEMLIFSDEKLEQCHDQIQWMFPLHEYSNHADTYPVITKSFIEQSRNFNVLHDMQCNLILGKERMEKFYGIVKDDKDIDKQRKWCRDGNHNLLRITRIIRSLRLFGLETIAQEFYSNALEAADYFGISQRTLDFWKKAAEDDPWESLR